MLDIPNRIILPEGAKTIRVTERQQFKRCRRQWGYAYRDKIQPKDAAPDARSLGTAVHSAIQAYYDVLIMDATNVTIAEDNAWTKWAKVMPSLEYEQQQMGNALIDGYFRYAKEADEGFTPLATEVTLYGQIPGTDVYLKGTMDLFMRNHRGIWIFDHKTYKDFLNERQAEFDDQLTLYTWLCLQNGIKVKGAYYNQLRKSIPREPELLKSGALSKNNAIITDKRTYRACVERHGLDPADYKTFLDNFIEAKFFDRLCIIRSPRAIQSFGEYLIAEAKDMHGEDTVLYPNHSKDCLWCDFTFLCRTQTDRGDVANVMQELYVIKPDETPIRRES